MITQKTQLAIEINERDFVFQCEPSSPLEDVFGALDQMRAYVYGRIKEAEEAKKAAEETAQPQG